MITLQGFLCFNRRGRVSGRGKGRGIYEDVWKAAGIEGQSKKEADMGKAVEKLRQCYESVRAKTDFRPEAALVL